MRFALCLQMGLLFATAAAAQSTQPDRRTAACSDSRYATRRGREQAMDFTMSVSDAHDDNRLNEADAGASHSRSPRAACTRVWIQPCAIRAVVGSVPLRDNGRHCAAL
jgi:hypothetical protein